MIGSPAPRLETCPSPAKAGIEDPLSIGERRPSESGTEGPPAVAIAAAGKPRAILIETAESRRVIRRACVLRRGHGGCRNRVNLAGDPAVKFISLGDAADFHGGIVTGVDRERLAFFEKRRLFLMQDGEASGKILDRAPIVEIVETEGGASIRFHREIAARDAEIIVTDGVHMERSASLPQHQTRNQRAIL